MPPRNLVDNTGKVLATVDAPEDATREQLIELAKAQRKQRKPSSVMYPFGIPPEAAQREAGMSGFKKAAPDIAAGVAAMIPAVGEAGGLVSPALRASRFLGKAASPLARFAGRLLPSAERIALSEAAGRGTEAATGQKSPPWYVGHGARQAVGEVLALPIQWGINAFGAQSAREATAAAREAADVAYEHSKAAAESELAAGQARGRAATEMGEGVVKSRQAHYEEQLARFGQVVVPQRYMAQARAAVPAFQALPETLDGMDQMVGIEGQRLLSERFKPALEASIAKGQGQMILARAEDVQALGLKPLKLRVQGGVRAQTTLAPEGMAYVDAGQAAAAITGTFEKKPFWQTNPGLYNRMIFALDDKGLVDHAAGQEYRLGQAARQFVREGKIIKADPSGRPTLDVDAYQKALTRGSRALKEVERRKAPVLPFGQVLEGRPTEPAKVKIPDFSKGVEKRTVPPKREIPEPDIRTRRLPLAGHPFAMGALAEAPFAAAGHHGYGLPFAAGVLASEVLPKEIVTSAPLSPAQKFASELAPGAIGAGVQMTPEYLRKLGVMK